jgi:hypothetical protein
MVGGQTGADLDRVNELAKVRGRVCNQAFFCRFLLPASKFAIDHSTGAADRPRGA